MIHRLLARNAQALGKTADLFPQPRRISGAGGCWVRTLNRISNGDLLAGNAPSKVLRQGRRWIEENRAELSATWDEFQR